MAPICVWEATTTSRSFRSISRTILTWMYKCAFRHTTIELLAGRDEGIPVDFAYPLLVELVRNPTWNWESREDVVYNQCAHSPSSANSQSGQAHKSAGRSGMGAVRGSRARR
eukprot:GEMP01058499.1.p2 GENE.GEMP01058499.1~~GEMP01058499.1.p2  ORF type:complete len:112 (+),score=17.13 GEMP01058499.1:195-530(+)